MLWIIFLMITNVRGEIPSQQRENKAPSNRILHNELSFTYDHCRAPQILNAETWTCECPGSLRKKGDECICDDCLLHRRNESYVEKESQNLPEYVAGFLKDLDEGTVVNSSEIATRMMFDSGVEYKKAFRRRKRKRRERRRRKLREYTKQIINAVESICNPENNLGRRSMVLVANSDSPLMRFLKRLRIPKYKRPETIRLKKIDWSKARILNFKNIKNYPLILQPEFVKHEEKSDGMTYSDSSIGGVMRGKVFSGEDKAYGLVSNLLGTGSLAMGAGQGGALGSAYTGEGFSASGLESRGGKSYGMGFIGKKAYRGSSTTTLLIGEGDAIATNSHSKKSSASATAVATKKVATAASAAYGAASAAASASPGKGKADGSASFGDRLESSANVTGQSSEIAESAAVGNEMDDLRDFVQRQRELRVSDNIDRNKVFGHRHPISSPEYSFFGFGNENFEYDWFS